MRIQSRAWPALIPVGVVLAVATSCLAVHPLDPFMDAAEANDVNNSGMVVGDAWPTSPPQPFVPRAYRYDASTEVFDDLGTLGGTQSSANAINDAGTIVGWSRTAAGITHAFVYDPDTDSMDDLGTLGGTRSVALDINTAGEIVGWSDIAGNTATHAFVYDPATDTMSDLGTLGGSSSVANAINDLGQIVGNSDTSGDAASHAFFLDPAAPPMADLGTLTGVDSGANDLDEQGTVVGWSEITADPCSEYGGGCIATRAFAYDVASGVMTDLQTLPGTTHSWAEAINENGVIAGRTETFPHLCGACPRFDRAALWELGTTGRYDLAGSEGHAARAVNDTGLVAGTGWDSSNFAIIPFAFTAQVDQG